MSPNRIMMANAILFIVILGMSFHILTQERTIPGAPPVADYVKQVRADAKTTVTNPDLKPNPLPSLGKAEIFTTIIPLATPTPAPTRTPVPPPTAEEVTEFWQLRAMLSTFATFEDVKVQKEMTLKIGQSVEAAYKGQTYDIKLLEIDKKKWTVTVNIMQLGPQANRTFSMDLK